MPNTLKEQKEKIIELIKTVIAQDESLRKQHGIGDKFKFIRDRLHALLGRVEEGLSAIKDKSEEKNKELQPNEMLVYVYLFNSQGLVFQTWKKMLGPAVFYEYSVNRPIYGDKSHIEAVIRSKANRQQHAYLTIAVDKELILATPETKDPIGHPLLKVKEGSLKIERLQLFTHNNHDYEITETGEIVKKTTTNS